MSDRLWKAQLLTADGWFVALVTAGIVLHAWWMRGRLARFQRLSMSAALLDSVPGSGSYDMVTAAGVEVPAEVWRAAVAHAVAHDLQVIDLVPTGLSVVQALDLARAVDLPSYRIDPVGQGRGGGHAILAATDLLDRARVTERRGLDVGEMAEVTVRLRQYAKAADLLVVDIPVTTDLTHRRTWLKALGVALPADTAVTQTLALSIAGYLLVLAGLFASPVWGLIPLAVYCLAPYLMFVGARMSPTDLHRAALFRPIEVPRAWWHLVRAPRSPWELRIALRNEESRDWYEAELAHGVDRFLQPRQKSCPWCGSGALRVHVRTWDIIQLKPGRFTLERCGGCGHVFQNPQLTPEGLDFYYRDIYAGRGGADMEHVFSGQLSHYLARAEMVKSVATPTRWLDVGTGHGHFPRAAATVFPQTEFHGLDMGEGVEEAERRGWIAHGFRGLFPERIDELAGNYDVVSMHHYLEHTLDPYSDLDAAAKCLRPGGHLLVELPDPECSYGRLLRGFWIPWLAPQHLHLIPLGNLTEALAARGFQVLEIQRRQARQAPDIAGAAVSLINLFGPDPARPWAPRPNAMDHARFIAARSMSVPLLGLAYTLDLLINPFARKRSNAYRLVAVKQAG